MEVFFNSLSLILSFDKDLYEIIFLSLRVSLIALLISTIIGLPIAGILASKNFLGKKLVLIFFNSMMALPPVFVGLVLYVFFSQSGFFGFMNILYTPIIMIIAQVIIILPIIISVSAELLENIFHEYKEFFDTFSVGTLRRVKTTLFDARFSLITCILTGLGRALSEVGAIIIVGGNIVHYTRVMTTTIALETSRGNLSLAIALGIILIFISIMLNYIVISIKISVNKIHMIKKIGIKNVNFGFNQKVFFKNLSINFSTKGISVIIGPNGSGKSLITKLLKGIILPDSGEIQLVSDKITPKISYLSQKITFLRRDVYSNLAYPLFIRNHNKKQIKQKINKILKNFNFLDKINFSARSLSKGNKQFLAFIRSQIIQYDILVLDEPCSNLDFESIKIIEKYLLT